MRNNSFRNLFLVSSFFALAIALEGCASTAAPPRPHIGSPAGDSLASDTPPPILSDIEVGSFEEAPDTMTRLRRDSLREVALSYGAQLGNARRTWEIEKLLERRAAQLSDIYDFHRVVITAPRDAGVIIPPVVARSKDAYETKGGDEASAANEYLKIVAPGRLSPVVPTWRNWLLMPQANPEAPPRAALPKDSAERDFFMNALEEGWKEGYEQADMTLEERTNSLDRDYRGMLEYRRLVSLGMMKEMAVVGANFGVTGGGDTMRIGERTVRIVGAAGFNTNQKTWRPVVVTAKARKIVSRGSIGKTTPWTPASHQTRGLPGENLNGAPNDHKAMP